MKRSVCVFTLVLVIAAPLAAQPNRSDIVMHVWNAGHNNASLEAIWCFTEAAVFALHRADPRFGHLRKERGQNQHNGHAVDAVLFCPDVEDGRCVAATATAVDLIREEVGALPHWSEDIPRAEYPKRWYAPTAGCGPGSTSSPPPPPPPPPPPSDIITLLTQIRNELIKLNQTVARFFP